MQVSVTSFNLIVTSNNNSKLNFQRLNVTQYQVIISIQYIEGIASNNNEFKNQKILSNLNVAHNNF